jgi:drug/metabolite transporter (DMT)-like permease
LKKQILNHQTIFGYFYAIGATVIWSGNFIVARGLNESIPPISLAFWRWVVATLVLLPFALKPLISEWVAIKKNLPYLSITSLLGITVFNTLIYVAGQTTTVINLSLIAISCPIFIIIMVRFIYKELITLNKSIGIVVITTGVVLLITEGSLSRLLNISFAIGDVWMLAASIIFAFYSVLLKLKPKELSILAFQLSTFLLGLIFLLPFFIWETLTFPAVIFEPKIVYSILYVGIFASLTAFVLWNKAILVIGPSRAGMIYYTLPLFSGLVAYTFLNEEINRIHFYSALLILSGIFMANREIKKC